MARVAFDNVVIDQIDDLFEIGETESADAVRRQYAIERVNDAEDELSAQSGFIQQLEATVTDLYGDALSKATITQLQNAQATNTSARADLSTTLQATLGNQIASVQQDFTTEINATNGTVSALATLRVEGTDADGNQVLGGWGLGAEGGRVNFILDVDRFALGRANGPSGVFPFIFDGDSLFLKKAVIGMIDADQIDVDKLSALAAIVGTLKTAEGTAARVEISSEDNFPIWAGSGTKTAGNANFYVDNNGAMQVNQLDVIDTLNIAGRAVTLPFALQDFSNYVTSDIPDGVDAKLITLNVLSPKDQQALIWISGVWQANGTGGFDVVSILTRQVIGDVEKEIFRETVGSSNQSTFQNGTYCLPVENIIPNGVSKITYRMYINIATYDGQEYRGHTFQSMLFAGFWR